MRTNYATLPAGTLSIGLSAPPLLSRLANLSSLGTRTAPSQPKPLGRPAPDRRCQRSAVGLRRRQRRLVADRAACPGRRSRSTALPSASRPISICRTADGFRPSRCRPRSRARCRTGRWPRLRSNNLVEFNYALDEDETRGLAGRIPAHAHRRRYRRWPGVSSNLLGYVGAYYQWDNNWKVTGRVGMQSFGGADLLRQTPIRTVYPAAGAAGPRQDGRQ